MTLQQLKERVDEALEKGVSPLTAVKMGQPLAEYRNAGRDCIFARMDNRHINFLLEEGTDGGK